MTIKFVEGDGNIYAISENAFWKARMYDELFWAEVQPLAGKHVVIWQDEWSKKLEFENFSEASKHILQNYRQHKPFVNGKEYNSNSLDVC